MNTPSKPVRTNTKRFAAIFAQATSAKSFSLSSEFRGVDVSLDYIHAEMPACVVQLRGKVRDYGNGTFCVRYHSNHWVEIVSPA